MDCPTSSLFSDGYDKEAIEEFLAKTNNCVPGPNFVLPALNYIGPFTKHDEAVQFLTLTNIDKIKNAAITYLREYFRKAVLLFDEMNIFIGYIMVESNHDKTLDNYKNDIKNLLMCEKKIDEENAFFDFLDKKCQKIPREEEKKKRLKEIFIPIKDDSINSSSNPKIRIKIKENKIVEIVEEYKENFGKKPKPNPEPKPEVFNQRKKCKEDFDLTLQYGERTLDVNFLDLKTKDFCNLMLISTPFEDVNGTTPLKDGELLRQSVEFNNNKLILQFKEPSGPMIIINPGNIECPLDDLFPNFKISLKDARELLLDQGFKNFFFLDDQNRIIIKIEESKRRVEEVLGKQGKDYIMNLELR